MVRGKQVMMQLIGLLYFSFIIVCSCLIALILHLKFYKYPLKLIFVYSIGIIFVSSLIAIKYWQLTQLNSTIFPFTQSSGNTLTFYFIPKSSGKYSVDLTFLNDKVNKEYEACGFPWMKSDIQKCKKVLLFRTVSGAINSQHFSSQARYQDWKPGDLQYGYENHAIGPALNITKFHGIKHNPVNMTIKIDTTNSEIQSTKPAIVVGPDEESFFSISRNFFSFGMIVIPFLLSIILLVKNVKNKKGILRTIPR